MDIFVTINPLVLTGLLLEAAVSHSMHDPSKLLLQPLESQIVEDLLRQNKVRSASLI